MTQRQKQGVARWPWSLGLLLGFMVAGVPVAQATVRYATPGGVGTCASWVDACTLQAALSVAASGDEIWVQQGTHKPTTGTDRTATFQLKAAVALYGGFAGGETTRAERDWEANVTTLSGDIGVANDTADNSYQVVTGATGATLDGFTISGGNANGDFPVNEGGGMFNDNGSSPTLTNVTFCGNSAAPPAAGCTTKRSSPTLTNVTFSGNSADLRRRDVQRRAAARR